MVAVGVMKVGGEASVATINHVIGIVIIIDGVAIGGVAGAVMVWPSLGGWGFGW